MFCKLYMIAFAFTLAACNNSEVVRYNYLHPIPHAPEEYVCYKTSQTPVVDGKLDDSAWNDIPWTKSFVDIEGSLKPMPAHDTRVKMMWDSSYFYIGAKLEDDHIWATLRQRDTIIFQNDDFEVFIDPDGDTHDYMELELNAINTVWDLFLPWPYREKPLPDVQDDWNIEGLRTAVYIDGTINDPEILDQFWSVEIAIPWNSIIEYSTLGQPPSDGDQWRINFSRVAWDVDIVNNRYVKSKSTDGDSVPYSPQNNWVWSPQGWVNMHQPESWGYVQFSDSTNIGSLDIFVRDQDEKIKWALRQLYYQQAECKKENGYYSSNAEHFTIPNVEIEEYSFSLEFFADENNYTIRAGSASNTGFWVIQEKGKIWLEN